MSEELAVVYVLRHPAAHITSATILGARDGARLVRAGATAHFEVDYQRQLGGSGETLAQGVLAMCEADFAQLKEWFGGLTPSGLPLRCVIVTGTFGAFHATCSDTELHVAAFDETNPELVEMLTMAEVIEVFSANQKRGWNCGASNGEGLSRVLATELHPTQLDGFATAAAWLNSKRANFVDRNDPTDQDPVSTGCATLFLNYLHYQLGYRWQDVVTYGLPTLAETYHALAGGTTDAWHDFSLLLAEHFPPGTRVNVETDNVFPLGAAPPSSRPPDRGSLDRRKRIRS
jgi:hypothetical protein